MTQHSPELQRLVDIGQLDPLPPVSREIAQLIASGQRRLQDASMRGLSVESRFALTYGAAHSLSLAALRQRGYRSKNRYVVFQALEHTLGLSPSKWRVLAKAHDLRNLMEYEGEGEVDERLVTDMIVVANEIAARLAAAIP